MIEKKKTRFGKIEKCILKVIRYHNNKHHEKITKRKIKKRVKGYLSRKIFDNSISRAIDRLYFQKYIGHYRTRGYRRSFTYKLTEKGKRKLTKWTNKK